MNEFKTVGLIGRIGGDNISQVIERLINYLRKQSIEVLVEEDTASILSHNEVNAASRERMAEQCELIIVVGGDGSMLAAARAFAGSAVKLLGINRGRLGFLTDISPDDVEYRVAEVLEGNYVTEQRTLLYSTLVRNEQIMMSGLALNDVVVHPGEFVRMIEFELYIEGEFVYRQRSDGLIISTPTGSTAYALSGGGPILHPKSDAMVLVPLNPHTLTSRPIVVDGSANIRVIISHDNMFNPHVSNDGQTHVETEPGDQLNVCLSKKKLALLHPKGYNFYETCRTKLGWSNQAEK